MRDDALCRVWLWSAYRSFCNNGIAFQLGWNPINGSGTLLWSLYLSATSLFPQSPLTAMTCMMKLKASIRWDLRHWSEGLGTVARIVDFRMLGLFAVASRLLRTGSPSTGLLSDFPLICSYGLSQEKADSVRLRPGG